LTQDKADKLLKQHYQKLVSGVVRGFQAYRERYPHRPRHRNITVANLVNDEQWAEIITEFDEVPGVRVIEQSRGLRFLGICGNDGSVELLLWFKKVDAQRTSQLNKTRRSALLHAGQAVEMFPHSTVLVVGYYLNRDRTKVIRVSINRPTTGTPEWFIDLDVPQDANKVTNINTGTTESAVPTKRVTVRKIKQHRLAE
jgi:hypothetical protein